MARFCKIFFPSLILLLTLHTINSQSIESQIDALFDQFNASHTLNAGFGLAVIKLSDSDPYHLTKGYGVKSMYPDPDADADANSLYSIASITKLFTGTLAVKILGEKFPDLGEGVFDVPIKELLPELAQIYSDQYRTENMNFRDLLSHRTCIEPTDLSVWMEAIPSTQELFHRLRFAKSVCPYRSSPVYNNVQLALAAEILAAISKTSVHDLFDNFLREIGMTQSFAIREDTDFSANPDMALAYVLYGGGYTAKYNESLIRRIHIGVGGGGLVSSPTDMSKFMEFVINRGRVEDRQIIPAESFDWFTHGSMHISGFVPDSFENIDGKSFEDFNYAFGLSYILGAYKGALRIGHNGGWASYASLISIFPHQKIGIFSVANGPGTLLGDYTHQQFHNDIYDILQGEENIPEKRNILLKNLPSNKNMPKNSKKFEEIKINFEKQPDLEKFKGIFGHPVHGEIELTDSLTSNAPLAMIYGVWGRGNLWWRDGMDGPDLYWINWTTDIRYEFFVEGYETVPDMFLELVDPDTIRFPNLDGSPITFKRGLTFDTLPEKPWNELCEKCEDKNESIRMTFAPICALIAILITLFA